MDSIFVCLDRCHTTDQSTGMDNRCRNDTDHQVWHHTRIEEYKHRSMSNRQWRLRGDAGMTENKIHISDQTTCSYTHMKSRFHLDGYRFGIGENMKSNLTQSKSWSNCKLRNRDCCVRHSGMTGGKHSLFRQDSGVAGKWCKRENSKDHKHKMDKDIRKNYFQRLPKEE